MQVLEPWVWATLAAALVQTLRYGLQKKLKMAGLTATGATWARFLWSAPILAVALALWVGMTEADLPPLTGRFWAFAAIGGLGQILANVALVALFSLRHFAIGITFKKSEVLLTVLVGWLLLGEGVSPAGLAALCLGVVALLVLSNAGMGGGRWLSPALALGLASGACFALAGVGFRGATLALGEASVAFRAAVALAIVTSLQTLVMAVWLLWRDRAEMGKVIAAWRPGLLVGVTSLAGSLGWFMAFAQQNAAYVYAVGQVELLFSMGFGALVFGERLSRRELLGIAALLISIVWLVLAV